MKTKYLLGAFLMAIFGALVALFVYKGIEDKKNGVYPEKLASVKEEAVPVMTNFQIEKAGQVDFTYAAELTVHAVVHVKTSTTVQRETNPFLEWFYGDQFRGQPQQRERKGFGSGVIVSSDGYIITNNHVIDEAEKLLVTLNDNHDYEASVVGRDPSTDIALLKIKAENLPFVRYGNSDELKVGEWVLAVGNPFNLTSTVTAGIVSAKGRNIGLLDDNYRIESYIQTDAALNLGNSGGALVNTQGQLVGITSAIYTPSGTYAGYSFSIPVNIVKKVVEDLKEFGEVQRAIIGVTISDINQELAGREKLSSLKGALVTGVNDSGAADEAGLKEKDIVVKLNGVKVSSVAELQEQIGKFRPGDKTNISYIRDGKESTVPITMKNIENSTGVVKAGVGGGVVFGSKLEPLTAEDQTRFRTNYGVKVAEVGEGRFKELGIRKGNIILSINGKKVNNAAEVRQFTNNEQTLTAIEGIQSNGTVFSYQFRK